MIESKDDLRKSQNNFPERIYTLEEVRKARRLIEQGHRYELRVSGSRKFIKKTQEALRLIKEAGYYDFLRTYIREIREINGLSQLRECDSAIWANIYTVQNAVDAARLFIQKAWQMKNYIEGKMYYGHQGETFIANKAIEFLKRLEKAAVSDEVKKECRERIKLREENVFL
ncbi:TPA: hypothetical protein EYP75_01985 [Candidatus Bathyarchaeota archaeon]|nr:hypothetical protein [Candidatus Bathyarchaeota archaeon]